MSIEAIIDGEKYEIVEAGDSSICEGCSFKNNKNRCSMNIDLACPLGDYWVFKKKEVSNEEN